MADCPGIVHLAAMADGGLARLRAPGGGLTAGQVRAVADAAERMGSGVVDLTNRANLQIRGLASDAGPALAAALEAAGFRFHGEADRRRNILLDPFAGIDPQESRDFWALAKALDEALVAAPWIADLSPKFSFSLDGGGVSGVSAVASDVVALAGHERISVSAGGRTAAFAEDERKALRIMLDVAQAAAEAGPAVRAKDLRDGGPRASAADDEPTRALAPRFGAFATRDAGLVALSLAVPVGRLDPAMLRFLAGAAEAEGDGSVRLAPWSGVVLPGVPAERADVLIAETERAGFLPVRVAERLAVVACAGAPSCERAREPAKALGAAVLALAAREPERLPETRATLHLSACPKGCAGSAPADLLALGASEREGWTLHRDASPRRPGAAFERLDAPDPADLLARLAGRG